MQENHPLNTASVRAVIVAPVRSGGTIYLKLPYWRHETSWTDPTHYHKFTLETLDVFVPETRYGGRYHWYTDRKWRYVKPPKLNPAGSSIVATLEVRK